MRSAWPFIAGAIVAGLVTLASLPIVLAVAGLMVLRGTLPADEVSLADGSSFSIRDDQGRFVTRLANTTYSVISVPMVGEPRPRRLLARLRVKVGDDGEGAVWLDAWPLGAPSEFRKPPLYSIRSVASSASLGEDSLLWTERAGRRTAWSLADGARLFDADLPVVQFTFEPELRRLAALSVSDDELAARGGVAVITYAAPGRAVRRVVLVADDGFRANTLRATMSASRLVSYTDDALGSRVVELPLASGPVRIPVTANDMDISRAKVPAGLRLVPLVPWGSQQEGGNR